MTVQHDLQILARRKDIRSADRTVIRDLLRKLERKQPLGAAERDNLWAYLMRYRSATGSESPIDSTGRTN